MTDKIKISRNLAIHLAKIGMTKELVFWLRLKKNYPHGVITDTININNTGVSNLITARRYLKSLKKIGLVGIDKHIYLRSIQNACNVTGVSDWWTTDDYEGKMQSYDEYWYFNNDNKLKLHIQALVIHSNEVKQQYAIESEARKKKDHRNMTTQLTDHGSNTVPNISVMGVAGLFGCTSKNTGFRIEQQLMKEGLASFTHRFVPDPKGHWYKGGRIGFLIPSKFSTIFKSYVKSE